MLKLCMAIACLSLGPSSRAQIPLNPEPAREPTGQPRLEFDELEHDFGTVDDQVGISHRFTFTNTGTAPLVFPLEQRATGHGGPRPHSALNNEQRFVFAPGERGYFELRYNPHGKRGPIAQRLTILSNDPRYRRASWVQPLPDAKPIDAPIVIRPPGPGLDKVPRLEFETLEHDFGTVSDREELEFKFVFKNAGSGPLIFKPEFKATATWSGPDHPYSLAGRRQLEFAPGEQGYILLKLQTHGKRGEVGRRISIHTNDPRYK